MKKLSEELVDKQIIVERSRKYGNNFPLVAQLWKNYLKQRFDLDVAITSSDAAFMFALHKISRLANNPGDEDTLRDMINYAWLGIDYDEYVKQLKSASNNNDIVDNLIAEIKALQSPKEQDQQLYCFWYKRDCVYDKNADWGSVTKCPMGYQTWNDCDFNSPIEIN